MRRFCVYLISAIAVMAIPAVAWDPVPSPPEAAAASKISRVPYQVGIASWYGSDFQGKETTSGEHYDMYAMTAAHLSLPLGSRVRVTNLENRRSLILRINDRGPVVKGRIIDLSYAAAKALGYAAEGLAPVRLDLISLPRR